MRLPLWGASALKAPTCYVWVVLQIYAARVVEAHIEERYAARPASTDSSHVGISSRARVFRPRLCLQEAAHTTAPLPRKGIASKTRK